MYVYKQSKRMCAGQSLTCDQWSTVAAGPLLPTTAMDKVVVVVVVVLPTTTTLDKVTQLTRSLVKILTTMQSDVVQCDAAAGLMPVTNRMLNMQECWMGCLLSTSILHQQC